LEALQQLEREEDNMPRLVGEGAALPLALAPVPALVPETVADPSIPRRLVGKQLVPAWLATILAAKKAVAPEKMLELATFPDHGKFCYPSRTFSLVFVLGCIFVRSRPTQLKHFMPNVTVPGINRVRRNSIYLKVSDMSERDRASYAAHIDLENTKPRSNMLL
jgi:hypothetical protein